MATLTIRNLSEELVERIKDRAGKHGRSMEQEVRELLEQRYASRHQLLQRSRKLWSELPRVEAEEIRSWREQGRR